MSIYPRITAEQYAADRARHDRRAALGMPGATYRSVAEQLGVPRSTLHRLVPRNANGTEPDHDPKTGEVFAKNANSSGGVIAEPSSESCGGGLRSGGAVSAGHPNSTEGETLAGVMPGPQDPIAEPPAKIITDDDAMQAMMDAGAKLARLKAAPVSP